MVVAVRVDRVVELMEQVASVAGEEVQAADGALLKAFAWVHHLADHLGVAGDEFTFLRFGARGLGEKFFELMLHLGAARFRSIHKSLI